MTGIILWPRSSSSRCRASSRLSRRRFGCAVTTFYNMTEVSIPLVANAFNLVDGTSCGRPRPGVTARIVDENDETVPSGDRGRAGAARRRSVGVQSRLLAQPRKNRRGVAQPVAPHRRCVPPRRRRQFLFCRPAQGRDPAARREHLIVRSRGRGRGASGDPGVGGGCGSGGGRRG